MGTTLGDFFRETDRLNVRNSSVMANERIISADALRGFDMFWIMGGDIGFQSLDNIFHNRLSGIIKNQFDHTEWFGFHFEDIIMPLFLFLVGFSMVYSYRKRLAKGATDKDMWIHTLKRVVILWILGMIVQGNLLTYNPEHIKFYTNTLQSIASGYLISTIIILYLPVFYQAIATIGLMISYWAIAALIPSGAGIGSTYSPEGNVLMMIEKAIMGKFIGWGTYTWVISSLNFGASVMLGVFCGYIMQNSRDKWSKFRMYLLFGISLILVAKFWDIWHPIIKKIWTGSFVLFAGGICILVLALFFLIIDIWKYQKGFRWMIIIGSNAIFAYTAWHLFSNSFMDMAGVFLAGLKPCIGNWYDTLRIFGGTLILYILLWYMYRNKTFIKI